MGAKHIIKVNGQIEFWHCRIKQVTFRWQDILLGFSTAINDPDTASAIATFGCTLLLPSTLFDEPEPANEDVASHAFTLADCLNCIQPTPFD